MDLIAIVNGPNLNLLGTREPEIYGRDTLEDVENRLRKVAKKLGVELEFVQSNYEGALIDQIHGMRDKAKAIIVNAASLTHSSYSLRDALVATEIPFFEVHISNIYAREEFRRHSVLSDAAVGVVCGFGVHGYEYALLEAARRYAERQQQSGARESRDSRSSTDSLEFPTPPSSARVSKLTTPGQ